MSSYLIIVPETTSVSIVPSKAVKDIYIVKNPEITTVGLDEDIEDTKMPDDLEEPEKEVEGDL